MSLHWLEDIALCTIDGDILSICGQTFTSPHDDLYTCNSMANCLADYPTFVHTCMQVTN